MVPNRAGRVRCTTYRTTAQPTGSAHRWPIREYAIDLWATTLTLLPGHRLRVEIASSNFPRRDRNPQIGEDSATATRLVTARQQLFHDTAHPSRLIVWQVAE